MDNFREGLKYNPNERDKREITGRTSRRKSQRYNAKKIIRRRIMSLILAGTLTVGIGAGIKTAVDSHDEKYVSNIEEMQKYNIKSQDLQISPELYEQVMKLSAEIENADENNFKGVSNYELANYYQEMSVLYLNLLKEKVSTVTGMKTSDFTLIAPSAHGSEVTGTAVKDVDRISGVGVSLKSDEMDKYMLDVLELEDYSKQILNGDVDRDKLEDKLIDFKDELGEVATINLLREMSSKGLFSKDVTKLTSYRIETRGLQQQSDTQQVADIEK